MELSETVSSVAMKVATIGCLLSPFVEPPILQYVVWAITSIAGIVSIVANWKKFVNVFRRKTNKAKFYEHKRNSG